MLFNEITSSLLKMINKKCTMLNYVHLCICGYTVNMESEQTEQKVTFYKLLDETIAGMKEKYRATVFCITQANTRGARRAHHAPSS